MEQAYQILHRGGGAEIVEKKSRFIAAAVPVNTEEEALAVIEKIKKKYWDARHNCYAYVIGDRHQLQRFSDDGEPSQTAGKPILEVLLGADVHNALIVVTRYFGGVLLGTGGLVRAYTKAAQEGLAAGCVVEKIPGFLWELETDYNGIGKITYQLAKEDIPVVSTVYTDQVRVQALVAQTKAGALKKALTEATSGRIVFADEHAVWFSVPEKEPYIYG